MPVSQSGREDTRSQEQPFKVWLQAGADATDDEGFRSVLGTLLAFVETGHLDPRWSTQAVRLEYVRTRFGLGKSTWYRHASEVEQRRHPASIQIKDAAVSQYRSGAREVGIDPDQDQEARGLAHLRVLLAVVPHPIELPWILKAGQPDDVQWSSFRDRALWTLKVDGLTLRDTGVKQVPFEKNRELAAIPLSDENLKSLDPNVQREVANLVVAKIGGQWVSSSWLLSGRAKPPFQVDRRLGNALWGHFRNRLAEERPVLLSCEEVSALLAILSSHDGTVARGHRSVLVKKLAAAAGPAGLCVPPSGDPPPSPWVISRAAELLFDEVFRLKMALKNTARNEKRKIGKK